MGIPDRILQKPGALTDDEWEIMERPTQADVARLAGVSRTTVPYVMNNQTGGRVPISEETCQRLSDAIAELIMFRMFEPRHYAIGLIVPDIRNPHFWEIADGVEQEANAAGYQILPSSIPPEKICRRYFQSPIASTY